MERFEFGQNAGREAELTEEEALLVNLARQEADELKILAALKPGGGLYEFKLNQFKRLSKAREEAIAQIQWQRLEQQRLSLQGERQLRDEIDKQLQWLGARKHELLAKKV